MTMERAYMIIAMLILTALAWAALNIISELGKRQLLDRNKEHIVSNIEKCKRIEELISENAELIASCEQFANENATLASENARLQGCSFGVMMREWKRIEDGERIYYEKDHIRLIVEDGKVVGWYRP